MTGEPAPQALPLPALRRRLGWLAVVALVAIVAGAAGFAIGGASREGTVEDLGAQASTLGDALDSAVRLAAQPDARQFALVPVIAGDRAAGLVVLSSASGQVLLVATGLAPEPAGFAYRGWIEVNGAPRLLGSMDWARGTWSWSGTVDGLAGIPLEAAAFRVSLMTEAGIESGTLVLTGRP